MVTVAGGGESHCIISALLCCVLCPHKRHLIVLQPGQNHRQDPCSANNSAKTFSKMHRVRLPAMRQTRGRGAASRSGAGAAMRAGSSALLRPAVPWCCSHSACMRCRLARFWIQSVRVLFFVEIGSHAVLCSSVIRVQSRGCITPQYSRGRSRQEDYPRHRRAWTSSGALLPSPAIICPFARACKATSPSAAGKMEAGSKFIERVPQRRSCRCSCRQSHTGSFVKRECWLIRSHPSRFICSLNPVLKVTWFGMGESAAPSMTDTDATIAKVPPDSMRVSLAAFFWAA